MAEAHAGRVFAANNELVVGRQSPGFMAVDPHLVDTCSIDYVTTIPSAAFVTDAVATNVAFATASVVATNDVGAAANDIGGGRSISSSSGSGGRKKRK